MTGDLDALAPFEAELADAPNELVCPVCRLAQTYDNLTCARCGADLALLANTLREAHQRKSALYRALLDGDPVGALTQIEKLVQLTGPSLELAALRRVVRGGLVPIEVVEELREELDAQPEDDPATAYAAPAETDPLRPPIDAARQPYAALLEPTAGTAPGDESEPVSVITVAEDEPEPEEASADEAVEVTFSTATEPPPPPPRVDVAVSVSNGPPLPRAAAPRPDRLALALRWLPILQRFGWLILLGLVLALMAAGYGLGTLLFGR